MRKLCERPGCSAVAEASYGMDRASLLVWIDNNARSERELTGRLCRRHADALVVPRGWTIDDRRDPIPRLFRSIAAEVDASKPRPRAKSEPRDRTLRPDVPSLFEGGGDAEEVERDEHLDESSDVLVAEVSVAGPSVARADDDDPDELGEQVFELEYEPIDDAAPDDDDATGYDHVPHHDDESIIEATEEPAPVDDVDADGDDDPDATRAMPWTPQLTGRYSPDETGPVAGRLLGRAFGVRKDTE